MSDYRYVTETGVIVADTLTMLEDEKDNFRSVFGDAIETDAATLPGTLIQGEVVAKTSSMKRNADLANMTNPDQSYGNFLDAVSIFTGQERGQDVPTYGLGAILYGDTGTAFRAGTAFTSPAGDAYILAEDVEVEINRSVNCRVASVQYGPVPLGVGRMEAVSPPPGLDYIEITAATTVVLGSKALSDPRMKTLRNQTLFALGLGNTAAIYGRLMKMPNIKSVKVLENIENTQQIVEGVTIPANTIWVCVTGSQDSQSIFDELWGARGGNPYTVANKGTPKNGNSKDPYSSVRYVVSYVVAEELDVHIRFEAIRQHSASSEISVQKTIMKYANGELEGEAGFEIGLNISSYEIGGAVSVEHPALYAKKCTVALMAKGVSPTDADFKAEAEVTAWQIGILKEGNINVVINQ